MGTDAPDRIDEEIGVRTVRHPGRQADPGDPEMTQTGPHARPPRHRDGELEVGMILQVASDASPIRQRSDA
jgi:hypothetical protein